MISSGTTDRLGRLSKDKANLLKLLLEHKTKGTQTISPCLRPGSAGPLRQPTSWAQQRMWFIDQMEGANQAYNLQFVARLRGGLDEGALRKALDRLVERHETLRTTFSTVDGVPWQEISPPARFYLVSSDLTSCQTEDLEEQVQAQKVQEARQFLDLRKGPLIRGRLIKLRAHEHLLIITMHHIVSDFWSGGLLLRELAELYGAYREQRNDTLPALAIQYADYAQWQRQWLQGGVLEKQLTYWRDCLKGAAPQLELPTDRPRPAIQSYRGEMFGVSLDLQLCRELRVFARRNELTMFMLLYTCWAILVHRLSGQEDIVVGAPIANRQRPELEGLIGFFVNTLALRLAIRPEMSVQELMRQVREVTLGAYEHQDVPFDKVVEALQPQRSLSRHPLFQVVFGLQNAPYGEPSWSGLTMIRESHVYESSMFDLHVLLRENDERIVGNVVYATDLFDRVTVDRWMESFIVVLKAVVGNAGICVGELPVLSDSERRDILESFSASHALNRQEMVVQELFEEQTRRTPRATAVTHGPQHMTYAELDARANQLARYLRHQGVAPDELVGVCLERSIEMVVAVLAILKAGGAYLPLDPSYPKDRIQYMLQDAKPKVVLTQAELTSLLSDSGTENVELREKVDELRSYAHDNLEPCGIGLTSRNLVYVIYTSGSTGRPKGTAMMHSSMVNLIEWHRARFGASQSARVLQFAALSFDVAFQEIFSTLCSGATLVLLDEWIRRDPAELTKYLMSQSINRLFVTPLMLQGLAEYCKFSDSVPDTLEDVIVAGEQLRISDELRGLFTRLGRCRLHNHYGPTETHVVTELTLTGDPARWPVLPPIGRPTENARVYVLDAWRQPVPIGAPGEIYVGGDSVAKGYLRRPELTSQRFIADPFDSTKSGRMYRTGDVGRWRSDGTLEYLGRNDQQVKIRGFRIELGEIEEQLARCGGVKDAAVVAREDVPGEKRLVAYVTHRDGSIPTVEELRAHLQEVLPEYMLPSAFVSLASFPRTPSGKLDRLALPAPQSVAYATSQYEAPQGAIEEALARIWAELLRVEMIGRRSNFFELGGHSMLGARLIAKLREHFEVPLSVIDVFQHPTIQRMAKLIASLRPMALDVMERETGAEFEEGVI